MEKFSADLFKRNSLFLNDLKIAYVFIALFIIIVIIFNLIIGFIATDQSIYRQLESLGRRQRSGCCEVGCIKTSTTVCILQILLVFNCIIYFLLSLVTIISFIGLYTSYISTILCNESPNINLNTVAHSKLPTEDNKLLDLRQFAPLVNLKPNQTELLYFQGQRFQSLCSDYVRNLHFHIILCTIGFLVACAGFLNYLINFSVNASKLKTKQNVSELIYLNSEMSPFDAKY